ncbi:MAG: putative Lysyl endopeptidase [Chthoniobacteraceae bacterium]|nr:putative Lysyl endopeptidase [Chthoniobacteraceae bacterium]
MCPPFIPSCSHAIWRRISSLIALALFLLLTAAGHAVPGPLLDPSPDLTPVFKFTQNYNETADVDIFDPPFHIANPHGTTSITISGSMAGIQPSTFTSETTIGFELGGVFFSGTLGEGGWIPGKSSASFIIEGISDDGDLITVGTVTCKWDAKSFSIAAVGTTPDAFPVLDVFSPSPDVIEVDPVDETKFTGYSVGSATFADVSGERRIYLSGKNTATQKSFGSGDSREVIDLNAFNATGAANYVPPALSITSPNPNLKTNESSVTVQVLSKSAEAVDVKVGDEDYISAVLDEQFWEATVDLAGGSNRITVRATDGDGLQSTATVTVNYSVLGALTVSASANGTVSLAGTTQQELGATLKIKATPAAGYVFAEWTRIAGATKEVISTKADLSYLHDTADAELKARFVQNPFLPVVGRYTLYTTFLTDSDPSSIVVMVTRAGAFSGKLVTAGKSFSIKGQLAPDGTFTGISVKGGQHYQLAFDLPNAQSGRVNATLTNATGVPTSTLSGNRVIFSAANPVSAEVAGFYNALLTDAAPGVGRRGYATWTLSKTGAVRLAGMLNDGNKFSGGANVDGSLQWVFNASLTNKGRLFGSVHSTPGHLFSATARCLSPGTALTPEKADFLLSFNGEKFTPPAFDKRILPVFDTSAGKIAFVAASTVAGTTSGQLVISAQNKVNAVPVDATHPVRFLKINAKTGLFTGAFLQPASGKPIGFAGVFLSESKEGAGLFFGPNFSGQIRLTPGN